MKNTLIILGFLLLLTASCGKKNTDEDIEDGIYVSKFENYTRWGFNEKLILNQGRNNSICTKADSANQYTLTFRVAMREIKVKKFNRITAEAWIDINDMKTVGSLVACIKQDNADLNWKSTSSNSTVKKSGTWTKLVVECEIPKDTRPYAEIVVYGLWEKGSEVYFDDFIIKVD